ncbi:MAG: NAD-dependent epimerase/dehydratase family protein [Acidothermaceae bacterium]
MRRALVTGAAGHLGRRVVELFNAEGFAVSALVLEPHERVDCDRLVVGNARDLDVVRDALLDVDVVVHLAALPSPNSGTAEEVFCGNTAATFTVLEQSALAGVQLAVIASSQAISGLPFGPLPRRPAYLPIDELTPLQIADPYALSKFTDEATAAMMWWRHGLSVCSLRFPYLGDADTTLRSRAQRLHDDPSLGVSELWAYLDLRDAARACLAGAQRDPNGTDVFVVAAPRTLVPYSTESLLDKYAPDVPRRKRFVDNEVPLDLRRSTAVLGFEAQYLWGAT